MALYRRRGGRRLVRFAKRRCLLFLFAVSLLFLVYLAFFGVNCPFLGLQHEKVNRGTSTIETIKSRWKYGHEHSTENVYNSIEVKHSYSITEKGFQGSTSLPKTDLNYSNEGDVSYGRIVVNTPTIINMNPTKWEMLLPKFGFHYNDDRNVSPSRSDGKTPAMANLNPNNWEERLPRPSKSKPRRHHGPCKIDFKETVDDLLEPQSYMNCTKFSVNYVEEENHHEHILFEPQFGGHQTLEERENSYYARDQTLHCGFVKGPSGYPSSGFDLTEKDKEYMANCRVVVSSCIFGSSDFLRRPASKMMGTFSKNNVCFVMFLDELTMTKLSSEGQVPDDKGNIGLWRIAVVKNLPYIDMRRTGKVPKFLSHRLFPYARYSIWIDSKMRLQADPMLILEYFLWRKKAEFAISNHYDRHCVWEEVLQNKRLYKYNHTAIDEQFQFYQSDGLIKFNESDKNSLLPSYVPEGSFIVRAHTPMSNLFSCLWFNEVNRFTSRDQLSFAYTFLKLRRMNPGKPFFLSMFKDCERRAVGKLFHHRVEDQHPPPPPKQLFATS